MPRRITVPDTYVALLLPAQLADELTSLMRIHRQRATQNMTRKGANEETIRWAANERAIAGDILLALLEAKEA